jgi:hypothetical protein
MRDLLTEHSQDKLLRAKEAEEIQEEVGQRAGFN